MDVFHPWILHLNLFVIFTLLTYADHSKTSVQKIQHQINQTAVVGDTVTLYCNDTEHSNNILQFDDITWKRNNIVIFTRASFSNKTINDTKTLTNFTSDRMYINPAVPKELKINQIQASDAGNYSCYTSTTAIGWILTVAGHGKSTEMQVGEKQGRTSHRHRPEEEYKLKTISTLRDTTHCMDKYDTEDPSVLQFFPGCQTSLHNCNPCLSSSSIFSKLKHFIFNEVFDSEISLATCQTLVQYTCFRLNIYNQNNKASFSTTKFIQFCGL